MIKQAFRLIWNRRRTNALVFVELLVSFLVLCGVLTVACQLIDGWRVPLGFRYEGVWELRADSDESYFQADEERRAELRETSMQILTRLRNMDEIATVSPGGHNVPFGRGFMGNSTQLNGVGIGVEMSQVTPEMLEILEFRLVAGRWLEPGDALLNWEPNVRRSGSERFFEIEAYDLQY